MVYTPGVDIMIVPGNDRACVTEVVGVVVIWYPLTGGIYGAVQDTLTAVIPVCSTIRPKGASPIVIKANIKMHGDMCFSGS